MRARACTRLVRGNGITTAEGGDEKCPGCRVWLDGVGVTVGSSIGAERDDHDGNGVQEEPNGVGHQRTADKTPFAGRQNECRTGYADIPRTRMTRQVGAR